MSYDFSPREYAEGWGDFGCIEATSALGVADEDCDCIGDAEDIAALKTYCDTEVEAARVAALSCRIGYSHECPWPIGVALKEVWVNECIPAGAVLAATRI